MLTRLLIVTAFGMAAVPVAAAPASPETPAVPDPAAALGAPAPGTELVAQRTQTSKTFTTATAGTYQTKVFNGPVHYQDAAGAWQDIDSTLVAGVGGRLRNASDAVGISVAPKADDAEVAKLTVDAGHAVSFRLQDASPLSVGVAAGRTITYPAVQPGVDMRLTSQRGGLKEDLVLASPAVPDTYVFPMTLTGLTPALTAEGSVAYSDAAGNVRLYTPPGYMVDSNYDPHVGEGARSDAVAYELVEVGGSPALKVSLDRAWLNDPARVYPVTVDPSYWAPEDDTYVMKNFTRDNAGDPELKVGTYDGGAHIGISFMNFNMDALQGKNINSANFLVRNFHSWSCQVRGMGVYRVGQAWGGHTMTGYPGAWLGEQVAWAQFARGYSSACPAGWQGFDVRNTVHNWTHGVWGPFGLAMKVDSVSEGDNYAWKKFDSWNTCGGGACTPHIDISWSEPNRAPYPPSSLNPTSNSKWASTPGLSAVYSDPDGNSGHTYFAVKRNGSTVNEGPGTTVGHGGTSTRSIPALSEGTYTVEAVNVDSAGAVGGLTGPQTFIVDPSGPLAPSVSASPHSSTTSCYANNSPTFSWGASDLSGINGYSYIPPDRNALTDPGTTSQGTGTSRQYTGLADGDWYFHVRARNGANVWGTAAHRKVRIDMTAPTAPTGVSSSSHNTAMPSSNRTVNTSWSPASDATCGVKEYVYTFNNSETTPANPATDPRTSSTSATSGSLSDGTWWFHVRTVDQAGNVSGDTAHGPFKIDGTGPNAPVISSPGHTQDDWSTDRTWNFAWTPPIDASPIEGYFVKFDKAPLTDPQPTDSWTPLPSWTQSDIEDGEHWLHVRAKDVAGNLGATGHYRVRVDAATPGQPTVTSPTHPDENGVYDNPSPRFDWSGPDSASGIDGYSFTIDQVEDTTPDENSEGTGQTTTYSNLEDGHWYFHVRARNKAGQWGATRHYHIAIWGLANAQPNERDKETDPGLPVPYDPLPEVPTVPAPPDGLGPLFPPGGLLGDDPFFGGTLLPDENPVEDIQRSLRPFVPPAPAIPEVGSLLGNGMETLRGLPGVTPVFQLLNVGFYDAETVLYDNSGNEVTRHRQTLPICTPVAYHADGNANPLVANDLRIKFCPDASSLTAPTQRLTYQLDALRSGVKATVTVTYTFGEQRLRLMIDGKGNGLPVDDGTGPAIGSGYVCENASPGLPSLGTGVDTRDGSCVEMRAPATMADTLDANVTSSTSGPLDNIDLRLDKVGTSGSFAEAARINIENPAVSDRHPYTLHAEQPTPTNRNMVLEVRLQDSGASTVGEGILLEQRDPNQNGALLRRLWFRDVPNVFGTKLTATLGDGADVNTAPITEAHIDSTLTQPSAPLEQLIIEQHGGGDLLAYFKLSSFAPTYHYDAIPSYDAEGRRTGAELFAEFPNGAPAGGRLQVETYGDGVLEDSLDFRRFSNDMYFKAAVVGNPADPSGLDMKLHNSATVPGQLVQVLSYPGDKPARRLVLSEASVDEGLVTPAVSGQNVRWFSIPRWFDITFELQYQQTGAGAAAHLPGHVRIAGTSTAPPVGNRMEITDSTNADGTFVLVHKALSANHELVIDFRGTLQAIEHAKITRNNNQSRPEQATQLYLRDPSGGLRAQVTLSGPSATSTGLAPGSAYEFDGTVTNVPDNYSLGVDITMTNGRPTNAALSGTNSSFASNMALRIEDKGRGFAVRMSSFPTQYAYSVQASFSAAGKPTSATIAATSQSSDNPNGQLDMSYAGLRFVARSLMQTFNYRVRILEGDISDPRRAELHVEQSGPNPGQLLQFGAYNGSTASDVQPRFAFTLNNGGGSPVLREDGSSAYVKMSQAPQSFDLDLGRHINAGGGNAELGGSGGDAPTANVELHQFRSGGHQAMYLHGLAPTWRIKLDFAGTLADPDSVKIDAKASIRHGDDAIELLNYPAGATQPTQRFIMQGANGYTPLVATGSLADAKYQHIPEWVVLQYGRHKDSQGKDASFDVVLENKRASDGLILENPAGLVGVELLVNGNLSEKLKLTNIPGRIERLSYTFPKPNPSIDENCLGDIGYKASSSMLDVDLAQNAPSGCLAGRTRAIITDLPSEGFAVAVVRPDGSGQFSTKMDPNGSGLQEVGRITVDAPVPTPVAQFVNRPIDLDKQFCPNVALGVGCQHVNMSANPNFVDLRLHVDAARVKNVTIKTNIGENQQPKETPPEGATYTGHIEQDLWRLLPLFAVRNTGNGKVVVKLSGKDPGVIGQSTRKMVQDVQCCTKPVKTANFHSELALDGKPLHIRFYSWATKHTECDGSNPGSFVIKCNAEQQELRYKKGSFVHTHPPFCSSCLDPIPFKPSYDAYEAQNSSFVTEPGETRYYVPNLYDAFMSSVDANGNVTKRWSAWNPIYGVQSDWFWPSLLHEYKPDPLHMFG